jgi:catecholate siderophore receptor
LVSVYIQDQIEILPQLQAIVGVRYGRFETDSKRRDGLSPEVNSNDNLISPRFGLIFKPVEQVSVYGSFSIAHQPRAGDQLNSLNITAAALKPEKFTNIEAGIKWDILPDLAATVAFYQLDRDNVIVPAPNAPGLSLLTKGTRVRGVEAGISGRVTSAWSVIGAYTYQEGTLQEALSPTLPKGLTLAELPKHTFAVWNRYDFTPMWGAAFGVIGRSNMFAAVDNRVTLPDFVRVDAAIYARLNKYLRAQVNIENLFDVNYFAASHNNNNISPGAPILARASITATF